MDSEFSCPVCFEICENVVETECCHHIFCEGCVVNLSSCPQCRSSLSVKPSVVIRRIIGNMPVACTNEGCGTKTTRSNLKDHLMTCSFQSFICAAPGCKYKGIKQHYAHHLSTSHLDTLVKRAENLFKSGMNDLNEASEPDRIASHKHNNGSMARLGATGKYYCRGSLGRQFPCTCCDGSCGPTDGCNCVNCMKRDVAVRKLPRGWYVNRDGFACRKGTTGVFYCGRKVIVGNPRCDGWCGPTDGPNCFACQRIDFQYNTRYDQVWE